MSENSTLEYVVLGFLSYGERTGYEIKREIGESVANFYSASYGSIYPILKKLEQMGWASGKELLERGKQKRKYELTRDGRDALIQWLLIPPKKMENELLIRMMFYHLLPKEKIVPLFSQFIPNLIEQKAKLERKIAEFGEEPPVRLATIEFGRDQNEFLIHWFQDYLRRI